MEKLLTDLNSWDQEKEENFNKRQLERERLRDNIIAEKAAEKQRIQHQLEESERMRRESAGDEDDAPEEPEEKEEVSAKDEGVEGENEDAEVKSLAQNPTTPVEEEPLPELEGDSDEDFELIDIKQRVKAFQADSGDNRIPHDLINEAVRWRLNRNDCQNRGYVLDGYPRCAQDAKDVFIVTPTKPEKKIPAEGEEDEEPVVEEDDEEIDLKPVLQKNIYPESMICLNASELFLKRRSKALSKNGQSGCTKWQQDKLGQKLKNYNSDNSIALFQDDHTGHFPTTKFFQDNKTEVFEIGADGDKYEMFESMRIYIERFGRPYNYLKSIKELNDEREKHLIQEEN